MRELREPAPGSALIAEHVAQTLLVEALRLHLVQGSTAGPGWLLALADNRMNAVLSAMHSEPGKRWTLDSLAKEAGMSRSSFAAHFKARVGMPALEYLTLWRMLIAADRLAKGREKTICPCASSRLRIGERFRCRFQESHGFRAASIHPRAS